MTEKSRATSVGLDREKSTTSSKAKRHGIFRLTSDDGIDIGVYAPSKSEAIRQYNTSITQLDCEVVVERIPSQNEVRISWIDDKPDESDVPKGGRLEPCPGFPQYLSVVATAAQWCAFYSKNGRDFFPMWEAE